jgi:hypothetical protein
MYHYFRRGLTLYWSTDSDLVAAAFAVAEDAQRRGFPKPSPICSSSLHPSRKGYAFQISHPQEMG